MQLLLVLLLIDRVPRFEVALGVVVSVLHPLFLHGKRHVFGVGGELDGEGDFIVVQHHRLDLVLVEMFAVQDVVLVEQLVGVAVPLLLLLLPH